MTARAQDPLDWLLPGADEATGERARRVMTFARLFAHDASCARAERVQLALEGARVELERSTSERIVQNLESLAVHNLEVARGPDSFLEFGRAAAGHQEAWSALEEDRAEIAGLPEVPSPGEGPLQVVTRLALALERLDIARPRAALWRAHVCALSEGPSAGVRAFLALASERTDAPSGGPRLEALAGAAACHLDAHDVGRALELFEAHPSEVRASGRLRRLRAWTRLLAGAAATAVDASARPVRLPSPLAELRARCPQWLAQLAGRPCRSRARPRPHADGPPSRREWGASLLALFLLDDQGAARVVRIDAAPALEHAAAAWASGRDDACRRAGELEHEAISSGRALVLHRSDAAPLPGVLSPTSARACAVVPVSSRDGRHAGLLRIEWEHHLVPAVARLVEGAGARLAELRAAAGVDDGAGRSPTLDCGLEDGPLALAFEGLLEELGLALGSRRWWGLALDGERARIVATGGGAWPGWQRPSGAGGAVERALRCAGRVEFDQPDPTQSIHAEAASGWVRPWVLGRRVRALVAVESTRRGDVAGGRELSRSALERQALALCVGSFRSWHAAQHGSDVHVELASARARAAVLELLVAAEVAEPAALCGPAGAGKLVRARWLHFESARAGEGFEVQPAGVLDPASEEALLFGAGARPGLLHREDLGTLVIDDVERLAPRVQARLEQHLEGRAGRGPRLLVLSRARLRESIHAGRLRPDLGHRLERLELLVAGLAEQRESIPTLARILARRFAESLGSAPPEFEESALALLWRQRWSGNVRELGNVVHRLVLHGRERPVSAAEVQAVAARFRLEFVRRLDSRAPLRSDLEGALRTTRTARGTPNKTRAALYLGWDPDTLTRRLQEAGIEGVPD